MTEAEIQKNVDELNKLPKPVIPEQGTSDTTFDYKKTELEKLQEQYDIVKDHISDLKELAPQAIAEIASKEKELTPISEALKLAELKQDLEELNKNIFSESIDGITGLANSIDSIAKSWERIGDTDMTGWETLIAVINALGDTINGVVAAWETYQKIQDLRWRDGLMLNMATIKGLWSSTKSEPR